METSDLNPDIQIVDAREVYIVMKSEYRVSRNTRASWFFKHLNAVLDYTPVDHLDDIDDELVIVSVLPKTVQARADSSKQTKFRLTPQTTVTFLARRYRLVMVLDISPSAANVSQYDHPSCQILVDEIFHNLEVALKGLVQPFYIPGSQLLVQPEIYVTIISHTSLINCRTNQVLVQGVLLTQDTVDGVLADVTHKLGEYENMVASSTAEIIDTTQSWSSLAQHRLTGVIFDDIIARPPSPPSLAQFVVTPEANFVNMLRYGILGLQMLPDNSAAGIVILTDGVVGVPEAAMFDSLMSQLRHSTIECSFIHTGGDTAHGGLGRVDFKELMQFIAMATYGAYISQIPDLRKLRSNSGHYPMNLFHTAFLTWSFQRPLCGTKIDDYIEPPIEDTTQNLVWTHRVPGFSSKCPPQWIAPLMRKKHADRNQHTAISNLICCRLREGYHIRDVMLTKGESQLEVVLVLPWRENVRIVYVVASGWPLSHAKRQSHVEVTIEASYDFMHDSIRTVKTKTFRSPLRSALIRRFWKTLQEMCDWDQLLVHLQSFASQAVYYKVPDSVKQGVPLFFQPANSTPQVNQQLNMKDSSLHQFTMYWKLVLMLDINIWQKWMHTHRIGVILEHDKPLGRYLHVPNSSGRFHTITCNQALSALNFFLRDYCTFVLMDNHTYIKLMFGDGEDKPPTSFFVVRLASKPPCLVLRVAFLGGTPGSIRNQIISALRDDIQQLYLPQRGGGASSSSGGGTASTSAAASASNSATSQKDDKEKQRHPSSRHDSRPPSQAAVMQRMDTPCCVLTKKPIEKILMRYERVPNDFSTLEMPPVIDQSGQLTQITSANKAASSIYMTLSKYLYHKRWVWSAQHGANVTISMQAVGRILATLTKIRLQQGFNFAHANSGIINMAAELQTKLSDAVPVESAAVEADQQDELPCLDGWLHPCVMQYIVFPPHITTTCKEMLSVDEEAEEEETAEADGELQIITECWVEPQNGEVIFSPAEREHFDGLDYTKLPKALLPRDYEAISSMLTFEHLNLMCQSLSIPVPPTHNQWDGSVHGLDRTTPVPGCTGTIHPSISHMPFPFNLLDLLPKCQQVQLQFSTYLHGAPTVPCAPNELLFSLFVDKLSSEHDRQVPLTSAECTELLQVIQARGDYPFNYSPDTADDKDATPPPQQPPAPPADSTTPVKRSESANSLATNTSSVTNQSGTSQSQPATAANSRTVVQGDGVTGTGAGDSLYKLPNRTPQWHCFVRSITTTHIMLCFLPATYTDLRILMSRQGETETKTAENVVKKESETSEAELNRSESETRKSETETEPDVLEAESTIKIEGQDDASKTGNVDDLKEGKEEPVVEPPPALPLPHMEPEQLALTLPVYIYNCPLDILTNQLVSKSSYRRPHDIQEDLTFKRYAESSGSPCRSRGPSGGDPDGTSPPRRISENERWRLGQQESTTDTLYADQEELKQHCTMVSETFFRCFVMGVYRSLQAGDRIFAHDVDAAIDSICEESVPIEVSITQFVHCVCGHARRVLERASHERIMQEDMMKPFPSDKMPVEEVPQARSPSVCLPLTLLADSCRCESHPGLHAQIRTKFTAIMEKFFHPVPSNPDFYLYFPASYREEPADRQEQMVPDPGFIAHQPAAAPSDGLKREDDDSDVFTFSKDGMITTDRESIVSQHDSLSCLNEDVDEIMSQDDDDDGDEVTMDTAPLFVYLMCTVRCGKNMKSVSMHNLPTCLREVKDCFDDQDLEVDLSSVEITLDLTCVTLPPETNLSETTQRPCYTRMLSNMSQFSAHSVGSSVGDDDRMSMGTSVGAERQNSNDPLGNLQVLQKGAVIEAKKQIKWLLTDEIASSLRLMTPVSMETLEMVATHVHSSEDQPMCFAESVPLHFVYGPDQSVRPFIEDFERMSLDGYRLNKEGCYYYLCQDGQLAHAQALSCALRNHLGNHSPETDPRSPPVAMESSHMTSASNMAAIPKHTLEEVPFKLKLEKIKSPREGRLSRQKEVASPAETKGILKSPSLEVDDHKPGKDDIEAEGSKSPSRGSYKVNKFLVSPVTEPEGVNLVSTDAAPPKEETPPPTPTVEVTTSQDASIEVLAESHGGGVRPSEIELAEEAAEPTHQVGDMFKAEDIRISVTRPSPVKEVRRLTEGEELEDDAAAAERDRKSSGSSIQVLEDEEEEEDVVVEEECEVVEEAAVVTKEEEVFSPRPPLSIDTASASALASLSEHQAPHQAPHQAQPNVQLSPLTANEPQLPADRRNNLHRAHSSASFEKYHAERSGGPQVSWSGLSTPNRRRSGDQNIRGRHPSGGTPTSGSMMLGLSSRGSWGEAGYDGDSSDSEDGGVLLSLSDSMVQRPTLPNFWLIMKINKDNVIVYFHARDSSAGRVPVDNPQVEQAQQPQHQPASSSLCNEVIKHITHICRMVNQRLLLQELCASRQCNKLLVPEADEDVRWKRQDTNGGLAARNNHNRRRGIGSESSEDSEGEKPHPRYLAATMQFPPGHFECDLIWETRFFLHPRLKQASGLSSSSRGQRLLATMSGIQTLKTVLNKFAVLNRNNMFVIKEKTGAVFYLRVFENEPDVQKRYSGADMTARTDDDTNLSFSRSSSLLSLPIKKQAEDEDPNTAGNVPMSPRRPSASTTNTTAPSTADKDLDSISLVSSLSRPPYSKPSATNTASATEECIRLCVYGIGHVGDEISKELTQMLQRRLDDSVLEILTVMLARNPLCKLTPDDVKFIQRPESSPTRTLRLQIPAAAMLQQYALGYYLRQNLQQVAHPPKYAAPPTGTASSESSSAVFRDYTAQGFPPLPEHATFLYNKPQPSGGEKGGKGIACVHLSFVDGLGHPIELLGCPKPSAQAYRDSIDKAMFPSMIDVQVYYDSQNTAEVNTSLTSEVMGGSEGIAARRKSGSPKIRNPGPTALVQFNLWESWERGSPDTDTLKQSLLRAMRYAVCDIVTEYRLLTAPVCEVPQHYTRGVDSPMHSAPPSPMGGHSNAPCGNNVPYLTSPSYVSRHHHKGLHRYIITKLSTGKDSPSWFGHRRNAAALMESRSMPSQSVKKQISMVDPQPQVHAAPGGGGRTPKEKSAFSFVSDVFKTKSKEKMEEGATTTWQEVEGQRRKEADIRQKILKYEMGERGVLHSVFSGIMKEWMDFTNHIGVPTMQQYEFELTSRFPTDYLLREIQNVTSSISPDIHPRVFKYNELLMHVDEDTYEPYLPSRVPAPTPEAKCSDSSLELASCSSSCRTPGKRQKYIVIGRNVRQWRASIDYAHAAVTMEDPVALGPEPLTHPKTQKSYQKFKPQEDGCCDSTPLSERSVDGGIGAPPTTPGPSPPAGTGNHGNMGYVPRQRFLLVVLDDKRLTVFSYNWANELSHRLGDQIGRLVEWYNARAQLLTCILSQKLGLFQHTHFHGQPHNPLTKEPNQFTSNLHDLDLLVKCTSLPTNQLSGSSLSSVAGSSGGGGGGGGGGSGGRSSRNPSSSSASSSAPTSASAASAMMRHHPLQRCIPYFEDLYRDTKPSVPMPLHGRYGNLRDPGHRHGAQMLELRSTGKKETEKRIELEHLYGMWQQRMGSAHVPIPHHSLGLLKQSSRLIHSVATPLLFSPQWRKKLHDRPASPKRHDSGASDTKSRSRHSSGASNKSKRSDTVEVKRSKGTVVDSPEVLPKQAASGGGQQQAGVKQEEAWHLELRQMFITHYTQYLHNKCGFQQITIRPPSPKHRSRHPSNRSTWSIHPSKPPPSEHSADFIYLQKTLPGGIMLIEVGFREVYFCTHVYAFECTRLDVGKSVNPQLALIFTDECDKFKDLTHVHSFAHDFHLRTMQQYLSGRRLAIFKPNYHLTAFLRDFKAHYAHTPSFARNCVYEGSIVMNNTNSAGHHLFEYMLRHEKQYKMRAVKMMTPITDPEHVLVDTQDDFALICQYPQSEPSSRPSSGGASATAAAAGGTDYTVGLVITHDARHSEHLLSSSSASACSLHLRYWVLLTNDSEPFPKQKLEKKLGRLTTSTKSPHPASEEWSTASTVTTPLLDAGDNDDDEEETDRQTEDIEEQVTEADLEEDTRSRLGPQHTARSPPLPGGEYDPPPLSTPTTEVINYLGFSNRDQSTMSEVLLMEAQRASEKIVSMVSTSMAQCRRDILWQRMLLGDMETGRRKHRSGWAEPDETKDLFMTRLSFPEFTELLNIVTRLRLSDMDPRLVPLHNMPAQWYHSLQKLLINKYEKTHRSFSSADGLVQYLVILNPNNLDQFMMLGVDNMSATSELCAVFREPVMHLQHTPYDPNHNVQAVQYHMEAFINVCCYHMWTGIL